MRQAWPALRPIFSAAPYLAFLARRDPSRLRRAIEDDVDQHRAALIDQVSSLADEEDRQIADQTLRRLKMDAHLLIGIADLGGAWSLRQVTEALSDFADACLDAAFRQAARGARRDAGLSSTGGAADAV
ncbi:MAG: glutamine-synthetase adenylyltransferase, partial [Caulobacteraceae bacterium]